MRASALFGVAALAISMMAPATVWAWSTEQASPNGGAAANLADQEDPLKALQDKVNSKDGSKQSGFYFSAGAGHVQPVWLQIEPDGYERAIRLFADAGISRPASIEATAAL
jgi:hypothetical protein